MTLDNIDILSNPRGVCLRLGCIRLRRGGMIEPVDAAPRSYAPTFPDPCARSR